MLIDCCQVEVGPDGGSVVLSKIFDWYGRDFGCDTRAVLSWITDRLVDDKRQSLLRLLDRGDADLSAAVTYSVYDWGTNLPKS